MSETDPDRIIERPEVLAPVHVDGDVANGRPDGGAAGGGADDKGREEFIEQPAKVMRVGTMLKQLLDEVRSATLDEASRDRLRDIYDTSVNELGSALSPDLRDELGRLALPFSDDAAAPSAAELQIAQAQLVGWLEGLIQGIQATLFAQQMAAQQQLANMRGQLPPGARPGGMPPGAPHSPNDSAEGRPGTYL